MPKSKKSKPQVPATTRMRTRSSTRASMHPASPPPPPPPPTPPPPRSRPAPAPAPPKPEPIVGKLSHDWLWTKSHRQEVVNVACRSFLLTETFEDALGPGLLAWGLALASEVQRTGTLAIAPENLQYWASNIANAISSWVKSKQAKCTYRFRESVNLRTGTSRSQRRAKRKFLEAVGIKGKVWEKFGDADEFVTLRVLALPPKEPYPPSNFFVAESKEVEHEFNNVHLHNINWHDKREAMKYARLLDPDQLQLNIPRDQSCIIRDAETNEIIAEVIRKFCPVEGVLVWAITVLLVNLGYRRSVRKGDPGTLVVAGYSSGQRSGLKLGLVRNLRSKKHTSDEVDKLNAGMSSLFAFFWNLCQARLPRDVLSDIEGFLFDSGITRMDGGLESRSDGTGVYKVEVDGRKFDFSAELAPPSGAFAGNYARAIHYEHQPHKYSISWTITKEDEPSKGGNFFIAKYGIRIEQDANTVIVWKPRDWHGTSLHDAEFVERPQRFASMGLAFVTSNRLRKAWEDFEKKRITEAQLKEAMQEGHEVYVNED